SSLIEIDRTIHPRGISRSPDIHSPVQAAAGTVDSPEGKSLDTFEVQIADIKVQVKAAATGVIVSRKAKPVTLTGAMNIGSKNICLPVIHFKRNVTERIPPEIKMTDIHISGKQGRSL